MNSFFFPSSRVIPSGLFPEVGSQCQKRSYFQNCWWFLPSRLPKCFQLSLLSGEAPEWEPWHCVKTTRYSRVLSTPLSKEIRTKWPLSGCLTWRKGSEPRAPFPQYSLKHLILQSVLPNDVSILLAFLPLLIMSSLRILAQAALLINGVWRLWATLQFYGFSSCSWFGCISAVLGFQGQKDGRKSRWTALSTDTSVRASGVGSG